ncbi:Angiotensin-converting enzyme [Hypsibius exemplaris]|uniref:Angiotensin-converting enzyme n=1 Tax=Hypsibius exemplaris TaxID=2072580 RepID=A0A1W0WWF8_HYPEX|nr:Angiotensin-converting enzyme [Hypsibius exemplaris]
MTNASIAVKLLFVLFVAKLGYDEVQGAKSVARPTRKRRPRIEARVYDGFQYLEPCLIPVGTYIALEVLPQQVNLTSNSSGLAEIVQQIVESEIGDTADQDSEKSARSLQRANFAGLFAKEPIKGLAGIRPLSTTRLPMGIFVPDKYLSKMLYENADYGEEDGAASADEKAPEEDPPMQKAHLKIYRGVRRIVGKIKRARREGPTKFDYNATFPGLTPYEAVYIPQGLFVPLSAIPGKRSAVRGAPSTNTYFDGITALSVMSFAPGVFVPHKLSSMPPLPGNVIPSPPNHGGVTGKPEADVDHEINNSTLTNSTKPATGNITQPSNEEIQKKFIQWINEEYNGMAESLLSQMAHAVWRFETNVSNINENAMIDMMSVKTNFTYNVGQGIRSYKPEAITNSTYIRLYRKLSNSGDGALLGEKRENFTKIKADMERIYAAGVVCGDVSISVADMANCTIKWTLSPNITRQLATSRNSTLLLHIWKSWRDSTGKRMRPLFLEYLKLKNESAIADGYPDVGLSWRERYIEPSYNYSDIDFMQEVKELWNKTLPLYVNLHGYVRRKLIKQYPEAKINPAGGIPAHLLGSLWSYNWQNLLNFTWPYPKKPLLDPTAAMVKQNWTVEKIFRTTDKFFKGIGLTPAPPSFWEKSMLTKPKDRPVMCQPETIDFYNHKDWRIKMCADVTHEDLISAHQQMGALQYQIQYQDQYVPFREGANPGFMEAIGNTLALSVSTQSHMRRLGLAGKATSFNEDIFRNINFLYSVALDKVVHLPFSYLMDKYRYDVFDGKVPIEKLNAKWWEAVKKFQGICSPLSRTEEDFDAGAKFHIPADQPYIKYFVAGILQFQIHKALCTAAGHAGPLSECDIDGSAAAGKLLEDVMELGSSVPWQAALEKLTGSTRMDAGPMLEYFEPLSDWLDQDNAQWGTTLGWGLGSDTVCGQGGEADISAKPDKPEPAGPTKPDGPGPGKPDNHGPPKPGGNGDKPHNAAEEIHEVKPGTDAPKPAPEKPIANGLGKQNGPAGKPHDAAAEVHEVKPGPDGPASRPVHAHRPRG